MTDLILNVKNSNIRRVRLKPNLSNISTSNCYLNSTPINNFILPSLLTPPTFSAAEFSPSSLKATLKNNMEKSSEIVERVLKPSLRKVEPLCTSAISKSVHFNVPLTQVVHFYTPPLDEYDEDDEEETEEDDEEDDETGDEIEKEEEEDKLEDAFLELYLVKDLKDECGSLVIAQPTVKTLTVKHSTFTKTDVSACDNLSLPNWPLSIHSMRSFISQMVSLESAVWNNALQVVQGSVLVHNIAYEKRVTIRCSFNDWKSWIDVDAYYKESVFNNESDSKSAFDRFMFEIEVTDNDPIKPQLSCNMAIRYQTLGQEFWDNNNGSNFTVQSRTLPTPKRRLGQSSFQTIMQHNNNKAGLSIIPKFNFMEYNNNSNNQEEKKQKQCLNERKRDNAYIVSPQSATTKKQRHDKFRFNKHGATKIAAPPATTRSTTQKKINAQIVGSYKQDNMYQYNKNNSFFDIVNEAIDTRKFEYIK